jgi:hypothetical protein
VLDGSGSTSLFQIEFLTAGIIIMVDSSLLAFALSLNGVRHFGVKSK